MPAGVRHSSTTHDGAVLLPTSSSTTSTATTPVRPTAVAVDDDLSTLLLASVQSSCSITSPRTDLARSAHASARTVERSFRSETGMTLREWRTRIRMETAARLLRARTAPEAVAQRVGCSSGSAFRRVFEDRFGVTPSEYAATAHRPGAALPPAPAQVRRRHGLGDSVTPPQEATRATNTC